MADEKYELKQVSVRLKLAEAEPLYSTEKIDTPDKAAEVMAKALAEFDREYVCITNLDAKLHPINYNIVSIGGTNQAQVPIENVFKAALLSNATSIMLFHNHPSGSMEASREDIQMTKRLIEAGKLMNIPLTDHIIVAGGTARHLSLRESNPDLFNVSEKLETYSVHEPGTVTDHSAANGQDTYEIYQLKDSDANRDKIFEGKSYLDRNGIAVDKENYNLVYCGQLDSKMTLDGLFEKFNIERPEDFKGHSLSVSDVIVTQKNGAEKAFYVDSFGFEMVPEFLQKENIRNMAVSIGNLYLTVASAETGYHYGIYNGACEKLHEGNITDPDITAQGAMNILISDLKAPDYDINKDLYQRVGPQKNLCMSDEATDIDYSELQERITAVNVVKTAEPTQEELQELSARKYISDFKARTQDRFHQLGGMQTEDIELAVLGHIKSLLDDYNIHADITDVVIVGDRCRGLEQNGENLEVLMEYDGAVSASDLDSILQEDPLVIGNAGVEVHPVSREERETMVSRLTEIEKDLQRKEAELAVAKDTVVTLTVAECSEFHGMGKYYENIASTEEAVKRFRSIPAERMHGIKAIGINVHHNGEEAYMDTQWDVLTGKTFDLDNLQYVSEITGSKEAMEMLADLMDKMPEMEIRGDIPPELEAVLEKNQPEKTMDAVQLATEIDEFTENFDPYEYRDQVSDKEANIAEIAGNIENGDTDYLKEYLSDIIAESEVESDVTQARELQIKLNEYKPLAKVEELEEANFNMIDNVINNTKSPDEKLEEEKQKHDSNKVKAGRESLREKLKEKKQTVQQGDKEIKSKTVTRMRTSLQEP